jgi:hypothetical protein
MLCCAAIFAAPAAMSADVTPLIAPVRRQLKDLEERLASLRGYL